MIKIIKEGTRKTCECENCGCVFSYEKEDIEVVKSDILNSREEFITCPQCNKKVYISKTK